MFQVVNSSRAPEPVGPYSQATILNGLVFTSGQIALDPSTQQMVEGGIEAQTERVLENLKAVLKTAGSSLDLVVKTTCFLANMEDFAAFNAVYARYFEYEPARSCVAVKQLPKGALVEVECIAEVQNL